MSELKDLRQAMSPFKREWVYVPGFDALAGNQSELERQKFERRWLDKKGEFVQSKADRIRLYYIQDCIWVPAPESTPEKPVGSHRMFTEENLNEWLVNDLDGGLTRQLMKVIRDHCNLDAEDMEEAGKN